MACNVVNLQVLISIHLHSCVPKIIKIRAYLQKLLWKNQWHLFYLDTVYIHVYIYIYIKYQDTWHTRNYQLNNWTLSENCLTGLVKKDGRPRHTYRCFVIYYGHLHRPNVHQDAICYKWFKQRLILSVSEPSQRSQKRGHRRTLCACPRM